MKRTFAVWGQTGGNAVSDGYVLQQEYETLADLAERIAERSKLAAAVVRAAGFEREGGKNIRADFEVTLGRRCRDGGYDVESRIWVGINL